MQQIRTALSGSPSDSNERSDYYHGGQCGVANSRGYLEMLVYIQFNKILQSMDILSGFHLTEQLLSQIYGW